MSGKNNVNPDHYKVAGRDRPNEVLADVPRAPGDSPHLAAAKGRRAPNFIPGALPVGEAPPPPKRKAKKRPAARGKRPAPARAKRPATRARRKAA